ncbi:DUF6515 family protein [Pseudomonas citronellolis]|uniref:DUF6515 family protein n=1 Tax=Pseudomonas citronellolis TaxID=53408 RepID=UPI0023E472CA|nr:DUF6515 family protein [Pseudomonas citronellolis]MDF3931942.1 glycine zipper family protein [Pseudomonas citronellolis]
MKSGIWRLASVGLLSLAIAGQSLAEGQGGDHGSQGGRGGNGGGQWQGHQQGGSGGQGQARPQGGQAQGRPQGNPGGQWQGRPQGNQGGQWQGHSQGGQGGQWQGRPQGSQESQAQGRPQGNPGGQWQGRPQGNQGGQWQGRPQGNQGGQWQGRPQGNQGSQWQSRPTADRDDHGNDSRPGGWTTQWSSPNFNNGNNSHGSDRRPGDWTTQWPAPSHGDGERPNGGRPSGGNAWQGRPPAQGNDWHGRPSGGNWGPKPSYWRPGYETDHMPSGYRRVPWRGDDYFFSDGYWYRPHGSRYVVVTPPYGMRVGYLPSFAEQVWIGSMLYFLAAGTYYLFDTGSQSYEVVPPPQPVQTVAPMTNPYDVIAYPAYGQSPQQQAQDHYQCHTWAVGQSGFDPSLAGYAPPQQAVDAYRGALASCMQGRGYSVN